MARKRTRLKTERIDDGVRVTCLIKHPMETGNRMGKDGAMGLKCMHQADALTIAQDKASSVIWGMPGAAVDLQAVNLVLPLSRIPNVLISHTLPPTGLAANTSNNSRLKR